MECCHANGKFPPPKPQPCAPPSDTSSITGTKATTTSHKRSFDDFANTEAPSDGWVATKEVPEGGWYPVRGNMKKLVRRVTNVLLHDSIYEWVKVDAPDRIPKESMKAEATPAKEDDEIANKKVADSDRVATNQWDMDIDESFTGSDMQALEGCNAEISAILDGGHNQPSQQDPLVVPPLDAQGWSKIWDYGTYVNLPIQPPDVSSTLTDCYNQTSGSQHDPFSWPGEWQTGQQQFPGAVAGQSGRRPKRQEHGQRRLCEAPPEVLNVLVEGCMSLGIKKFLRMSAGEFSRCCARAHFHIVVGGL